MRRIVSLLLFALVLLATPPAHADRRDAPHAGQMDTDGILSPGEIPNPNIDYDKAQRRGLRNGDDRFDNHYNDRAADKDAEYKERERERRHHEREEWERDHRDDYDSGRRGWW